MKTNKHFLPATLALAVSIGALSNISHAGVLYPDPSMNVDLGNGEYVFAGAHPQGSDFVDQLQFSLAPSSTDISATLINKPEDVPGGPAASKLFDNSFLTLSLFDNNGNFITAAGAGGTISAAGLTSGATYTLSISGKTTGIFGGVYGGKLSVGDPAPAVPLPPALPGFAAALLTLGLRRKKSTADLVKTEQ